MELPRKTAQGDHLSSHFAVEARDGAVGKRRSRHGSGLVPLPNSLELSNCFHDSIAVA